MIISQTKLQIVDNSSASIVKVFKVVKNQKTATVGDIVKASVVSRKPSKLKVNLRKGEVVDILILECKSPQKAGWGNSRASMNKAVVVKPGSKPGEFTLLGSRIKSYAAYKASIREGLSKILALTQGTF